MNKSVLEFFEKHVEDVEVKEILLKELKDWWEYKNNLINSTYFEIRGIHNNKFNIVGNNILVNKNKSKLNWSVFEDFVVLNSETWIMMVIDNQKLYLAYVK